MIPLPSRAVQSRMEGVVRVLISAGADLAIQDINYGKTAEKIAEELAQEKILEILKNARK